MRKVDYMDPQLFKTCWGASAIEPLKPRHRQGFTLSRTYEEPFFQLTSLLKHLVIVGIVLTSSFVISGHVFKITQAIASVLAQLPSLSSSLRG